MMDPAVLRRDAEATVQALPPLSAAATRRTRALGPGLHGRRVAGPGRDFWQYRQAMPGDPFNAVDWRRSARSRWPLVRENEWEAPQNVWLWADSALGMRFRSQSAGSDKDARAALLALAVAILLAKAGERVGLADVPELPAALGPRHLDRLSEHLVRRRSDREYGTPPLGFGNRHGHAILISDFLTPDPDLDRRLRAIAASVSQGCLIQILDPIEEGFAYRGRILFESMGGGLQHRTEQAEAITAAYRAALARRRDLLRQFARKSGWQFAVHRTDSPPAAALTWLAGAIQPTQ